MTQTLRINEKHLWMMGVVILLLLLMTEPASASSAGGGLPFDSWLTKIQKSITGPFAFSAAIIGLVAAGATLIFGGDMNGFMRTLVFFVLVLSFLVAAQNTMTAITGKGAEISKPMELSR
ncbi:TPA: TrbC/VirB2 family protein [Legionella pneumophila]|jgi:type IV secretion system protein VirB2|uniref:Conjugal transfer protein TrbC n=1 Tax=Legionella waltersii TaxID=66969 RepID=A0A0W1AGI6_9GAMM|nr:MULTISPECIES: TrbC/VirB2 family protein [Legionella]KTD80449.1 conjugal transfer protein TrbC [Legionella waltersii]MBN5936078.1 TrbC/VirB2 family protein [Legionella anisa]SNV09947.1 Conjugal transfer protein [Legionella waltersii]HAT1130445.1 conjugal transfer protein TrbC [Legionella pneumophila]HAT1919955.1 conjugal transfer protein TrbC [Legionella pneumophila]